ncbi:hypothetical protein [Leptospira alstonii]|uniref:Uncharacterized protein n=2 Tax=Leptospira alstonii TaxID=28452 RepID=M6D0X9_9LEPT|nr:hypothetical protein [Leptospira alstonii]EMJ97609.1 hypothetical protein LEP1GSC194_2965 [Leptospira alstonii serovar Sichuan str. 79601]EQA79357.1 hypothetical protein LEP1GSC193_3186 [Leptospira alstonii serovar Pingchang str. 80-412]
MFEIKIFINQFRWFALVALLGFNREIVSECSQCYTIVYVQTMEKSGKKGNFFFDVRPEIEDSAGKLPPIRLNGSGPFGELEIDNVWKRTGSVIFYRKIRRSTDEFGDKSYCSRQNGFTIKAASIRRITIIRHIQDVYSPIRPCKSERK